MSTTRASQKQLFEHALRVLLRLPDDSALEKALTESGQDDLVVILSMMSDDIAALQ